MLSPERARAEHARRSDIAQVLNRVAKMNEVIKTYRELFNGDSDSDDDSVEEAREARRHAKQAGGPAGRLGFVMPKHGPGDYGKPLVEDLGDYLKPLGDEDYDTLKDFLRAWRSAAVEQRNFAASSHRMATPENEGFAAYGALSAAVWKSNLQPDFNVRVIERFGPDSFAVLRELDESNRFVQKSAESTSNWPR